MKKRPAISIDYTKIKNTSFVIDEKVLRHNLGVLKKVKEATGCKIYQALKTWSTFQMFRVTKEYLDGTEVSSVNEARLGHEYFNTDVHMYSPAFSDDDFADVMKYSRVIIFNSFDQWRKFRGAIANYNAKNKKKISCGLRVNPEYISGEEHGDVWSPCAPHSRLGIRPGEFFSEIEKDPRILEGISGIHFHIFFDKVFSDLEKAISAIESTFGSYLKKMTWVNWGGGQRITDDSYDVPGLIHLIRAFQKKYDLTVHLEPGAAICRDAGVLVTTVLDVIHRPDLGFSIAILDMSFNAHTPDFLLSPELDMPVCGATVIRSIDRSKKQKHIYQLTGGTCVTGDVLSHFHVFEKPLTIGDRVVLLDAIQYNLVQCTMFNGVKHPDIVVWRGGKARVLRVFNFADYKNRMG